MAQDYYRRAGGQVRLAEHVDAPGVVLRVIVIEEPERQLVGLCTCEVLPQGVRLRSGDHPDIVIPVGSSASYVGASELLVDSATGRLRLRIVDGVVRKNVLAADLAGFLDGSRPIPRPADYGFPWRDALFAAVVAMPWLPWWETPVMPLFGLVAGVVTFLLLSTSTRRDRPLVAGFMGYVATVAAVFGMLCAGVYFLTWSLCRSMSYG